MKGLNHFIVSIPKKYKDTYVTESGLELYADRRWSLEKVGNTVVEVLEIPLNYDGPISTGDLLFLDIDTLARQKYVKGGELESQHLIDREKNLYKIDASLILAYKFKDGGEWLGFGENVLCDKVKEKKEPTSNLIILPTDNKEEVVKNKLKVAVLNNDIKEQGVCIGDVVYVKPTVIIDVWLENKLYTRVRNRDVLGVAI